MTTQTEVRPREGDLNRSAVVDAAIEMLPDTGLDGLTLTGLAERLGVSQPAMYRHLDGVDDLWRELGLEGRNRLAETLGEAAMGRSGVEAVEATAYAWRAFATESPELYAATDRIPCAGDPDLEYAVQRIVEILSHSLRGFGLDDAKTIDAAGTLRSALHGFVHLEIVDEHPAQHDNDAGFAAMVDMLCVGLEHLAEQGEPQ
ncbi:MAG: WHG domain-containing protein [Acidimicrobiia bacterium]|nr:WHG domain-containing protein [Acidimicrobiia bacterium]